MSTYILRLRTHDYVLCTIVWLYTYLFIRTIYMGLLFRGRGRADDRLSPSSL